MKIRLTMGLLGALSCAAIGQAQVGSGLSRVVGATRAIRTQITADSELGRALEAEAVKQGATLEEIFKLDKAVANPEMRIVNTAIAEGGRKMLTDAAFIDKKVVVQFVRNPNGSVSRLDTPIRYADIDGEPKFKLLDALGPNKDGGTLSSYSLKKEYPKWAVTEHVNLYPFAEGKALRVTKSTEVVKGDLSIISRVEDDTEPGMQVINTFVKKEGQIGAPLPQLKLQVGEGKVLHHSIVSHSDGGFSVRAVVLTKENGVQKVKEVEYGLNEKTRKFDLKRTEYLGADKPSLNLYLVDVKSTGQKYTLPPGKGAKGMSTDGVRQ